MAANWGGVARRLPARPDWIVLTVPILHASMLIAPVPCARTFLATVFSARGLRASTIGSNAGLNAVPQPCQRSASGVAGAVISNSRIGSLSRVHCPGTKREVAAGMYALTTFTGKPCCAPGDPWKGRADPLTRAWLHREDWMRAVQEDRTPAVGTASTGLVTSRPAHVPGKAEAASTSDDLIPDRFPPAGTSPTRSQ